ncbi:MAG: hypothetical protein RBT75_11000 [Anaerolineae bacterium]|jgi:hypothetical protein|nr:hypothetical protein [Anaerolineae bacterium]
MKGKWLVLVLVLGALLLVGALGPNVVAERLPQGSGDGSEPDTSLSTGVKFESAPDMDGYIGPVYQGIVDLGSEISSADGLPGELPDWEQFFLEPQPDQDEGAIKTADAGIAWSGFYYKYIAGSTLRPRSSSTTWATDGGGGCVYAVSGAGEIFNVPLSLPQGSRIDFLRLYYYDTNAGDSNAWVTVYNGAGGFADLTLVASTSNTGYGTTLSPELLHVVNNADNAYVLNWRANVVGNSIALCGLRVAYRLP